MAGCRPEPKFYPIGEARIIERTAEGNFVVTAAFVREFYQALLKIRELEARVRWLESDK